MLLAALACDSDEEVGKAEFSLYMMKFANNPEVKSILKFLEKMVSQAIEFDLTLRVRDERKVPFSQMINMFKNDDKILRGEALAKVLAALKEGMELERQRVNDFRSNMEIFENKQSVFQKLPEEVFRLEHVYKEALD